MIKLADIQTAIADKNQLTADLAAANQKIDTLIQDIEAARAESADHVATIQTLTSDLEAARGLISSHEAKIGELEKNQRTVSEATVETLAELGVPAAGLPGNAQPVKSDADIYEEYKSLTGADRTKFFREHRAALERYAASLN